MKEFGLFIDGEWHAAKGGKTAPTINPATEEPWATVAVADREDVRKAVAAAKRAHDSGVWRNKSPQERGEILQRVAMAIFERQDEVAAAEVQDGGGTMRKAMSMDVPGAAQTFMHFGQFICGDEYKAMIYEEYDETVPIPSARTWSCASRSASAPASRRGTSRSSWRRGRSRPRSRPATASC